jgi:hypothetical protein
LRSSEVASGRLVGGSWGAVKPRHKPRDPWAERGRQEIRFSEAKQPRLHRIDMTNPGRNSSLRRLGDANPTRIGPAGLAVPVPAASPTGAPTPSAPRSRAPRTGGPSRRGRRGVGDPGTDHHPHDRDQHCGEGCCHPSRPSACETPKLRAPLAAAARKARIVLPLPSMGTLPGFHPHFCQPYLGSCGSGRTRSRLWS